MDDESCCIAMNKHTENGEWIFAGKSSDYLPEESQQESDTVKESKDTTLLPFSKSKNIILRKTKSYFF